jgi:hypothetical protein
VKRRAVVGREDDVAEEVRHAERLRPRARRRGHLGVEREQHDGAVDGRSDDGQRHGRRCLRRQDEARAAGEQDGLVEGDANGLLRERLRSDDPRRRPVLDDERVHLVDGGGTAHRLPEPTRTETVARLAIGTTGVQHDAKRVRRLRGAGERAAKAAVISGSAPPSKASTPSTQTCTLARFTPSAPVSTSSRASVESTGTPVSPGLGSRFTTTSRGVLTTSATLST